MELIIGVEGMTCRHCEMTVEKALLKLEGVKEVKASHIEKKVIIHYENQNLSKEDFFNAVEETGYIPIRK